MAARPGPGPRLGGLLGGRLSRGRGAAGHAVAAIARWAFTSLRIPRLELYVEPWNQASVRTAERAGFRREGLLRSWQEVGGERRDMYMYSLLPADLPDSVSGSDRTPHRGPDLNQ